MNAADRIALILGRSIIRAETLQAENELLRAQLAEREQQTADAAPGPKRKRQSRPTR